MDDDIDDGDTDGDGDTDDGPDEFDDGGIPTPTGGGRAGVRGLRRADDRRRPVTVEAAIASLHATVSSYASTDWRHVSRLCALLDWATPSPVIRSCSTAPDATTKPSRTSTGR